MSLSRRVAEQSRGRSVPADQLSKLSRVMSRKGQMLDFIHARTAGRPKNLSATIVGAAIVLVGSLVPSADRICPPFGRQGGVHCQYRQRHRQLKLSRQDISAKCQHRRLRHHRRHWGRTYGYRVQSADRGGHRRHVYGTSGRAYGRRRRAGGAVSECKRCHPGISWSTAWFGGIPRFGWDDHWFAINTRSAPSCRLENTATPPKWSGSNVSSTLA